MAENFEQSLKDLENIVELLNKGEKNLNESIDLYKQGLDLVKVCYKQLKGLEKKVKVLVETDGKIQEKDFE